MKIGHVLAILALVMGFGVGLAQGQNVPQLVNYQGRLRQADGTPATDGPHDLTFTLYDAATDGTAKWTETQSAVQVGGGLFHVLLGSTTSLDASVFPAGQERYLAIAVDGGAELAPRQKIASVPYALRADTVSPQAVGTTELADAAVTSDKLAANIGVWAKSGTTLSYTGGNVNVGADITGARLNVSGNINASGYNHGAVPAGTWVDIYDQGLATPSVVGGIAVVRFDGSVSGGVAFRVDTISFAASYDQGNDVDTLSSSNYFGRATFEYRWVSFSGATKKLQVRCTNGNAINFRITNLLRF